MATQNPYRRTSKRFKIAEISLSGGTKRDAYAALKPLVEDRLMVFSANQGGRRVPKPLATQLIELKNEIGRVYKELGRAESPDFDAPEIEPDDIPDIPDDEIETLPEEGCDNCGKTGVELFHDDESGQSLCEDCLPTESDEGERTPEAKGKARIKNELQYFLKRVREIREFCRRRAETSESIDSISMRPAQAAGKLIPAGIPADALLSAMTLHWPKDARNDAGISDFDFIALSRQIAKERGIEDWRDSDGNPIHALFAYALVLAENRQPIMLVGPAGSGKSHIARQISDFLNLKYGETPMTPGATRGDLLGRHTIGGFIPSEFCILYSAGGVFNFEEIDASDPSMLIVLNNALAQRHLYNSANGEMYERHSEFVAVSTANTFGLGANREFTARERLDAATIDRWRMGRIFVGIDESIEEALLAMH